MICEVSCWKFVDNFKAIEADDCVSL